MNQGLPYACRLKLRAPKMFACCLACLRFGHRFFSHTQAVSLIPFRKAAKATASMIVLFDLLMHSRPHACDRFRFFSAGFTARESQVQVKKKAWAMLRWRAGSVFTSVIRSFSCSRSRFGL